jgi:hypothetical protein
MKRHFFLSDDLDDLEELERELERDGVPTEQIHTLTLDDTAAERHPHLNDVQSLMKRDVLHSGSYGLVVGIIGAATVLVITWLAGWYTTQVGWIPFIFLAIIVLGFFTWEGGFIGIQTFNASFERFRTELEAGRHLFFVDLRPDQEPVLRRIIVNHPSTRSAGTGRSTPHWLVTLQRRARHLFVEKLP